METISIKLEGEFAKNVEKAMKKHNYTTKTEFIREAMGDKIKELETQEALKRIDRLYGTSRIKTTDKQLHVARERAFEELEKERKIFKLLSHIEGLILASLYCLFFQHSK